MNTIWISIKLVKKKWRALLKWCIWSKIDWSKSIPTTIKLKIKKKRVKSCTYMKRYISMPSIDRPNSKTSVSCHCSMYGTMCQQSAVNIVRCIGWNCANHICWICNKYIAYYYIWLISCMIYWHNGTKDNHIYSPIYLRFIGILPLFVKWSYKKDNKSINILGIMHISLDRRLLLQIFLERKFNHFWHVKKFPAPILGRLDYKIINITAMLA